MEKFVDILAKIDKTREAIKASEAKENELIDNYMKISDLKERHEAWKASRNDTIKVSEEKQNLQITLKILQNNAKIALFNEVMPVALEVLSKYNNKPYGEKTKAKISNEVKEKTNCYFYITSRFGSDSFNIYPSEVGNEYNITCGTVYTGGNQKQILIENKIQPVKFEEVVPYYIDSEYITDIPQRVKDLKAAYKDAVIKQEELRAACERFNSLAVGINHIYPSEYLSENIKL